MGVRVGGVPGAPWLWARPSLLLFLRCRRPASCCDRGSGTVSVEWLDGNPSTEVCVVAQLNWMLPES